MSKALEMLQRVSTALSVPWSDDDRVSVTPEGRRKLALLHQHELMDAHGVPPDLQAVVDGIREDDPLNAIHWQNVRASAQKVIDENQDGYVGDGEHFFEYLRMLVATVSARQAGFPDDALSKLNAANQDFLVRHLRASNDYAPTITDAKARVLAGCVLNLDGEQFNAWLQDIDVFKAKAARHEYTRADVLSVRGQLVKLCDEWIRSAKADEARMVPLIEAVKREFDSISQVAERHALGPAHLEALEHQWRSYKFNSAVMAVSDRRDDLIGALQGYTITALRAADTYCWAPQTTQAVHAASDGLPQSCAPSVSTLGDIAQTNRSGWWWFQEPIPVQTTDKTGADQPVVALLWRYGLQDVQRSLDFPKLQPEPRLGLWLQTFVMQRLPLNGRQQDVAVPTLAWIWHDNTTLEQLPDRLMREYKRLKDDGKSGSDAADEQQTLVASMAFSRFFVAAAAWLRQKIVIESHGGQGIRQAARQIQRQHKLAETPRVRIVELRRSQYVKREDATVTDGTGRRLTCRFVVKGFWRNQWYATRGEHAPKYIESFLKGPADAPLKAAAPTVFVVRR